MKSKMQADVPEEWEKKCNAFAMWISDGSVPEGWGEKECNAFREWVCDDRNFAVVMREMERQGYFESFIGPDGELRARRTAKLYEPFIYKDQEKLS
jgi:hypothetical protein